MSTKSFLLAIVFCLFALLSCEKLDDKDYEDEDGTSTDGGSPVEYVSLQDKSAKRGVSFSFEQLPDADFPLLGPAITWDYNWASTLPSSSVLSYMSEYEVEFCPMVWNANYSADNIRACKNAGAEYLLGFNEPNLTDQANMTPAEAAKYWPDVVALAKELNLKLISPAMNYGTLSGYSDPWTWLDEFLEQDGVSLDDIDGIAVHCYMNTLSGLKNYIDGFKKYGKPIWLTEFCGYTGSAMSASTQINYMVECINYLESDEDVFRYAWFIPRGNAVANVNNELLTSKTPVALTDIGTVFVNMSTWDKNLYYSAGTVIPAEHYSACSSSVHLRLTTDETGVLDVSDLKNGGYVEYQVNASSAGTYTLQIRCSDYNEDSLTVSVDGVEATEVELENMANEWRTVSASVELPKGNSTLRVTATTSYPVYLNWLSFSK